MKLSRWLVLVVGLLFAPGCANTHITSSWKAADIPSRGYRNIMVAGIIRDTDRSLRAAMEQHLADDLRSRGYTA
ncbi:MAG: hypothetical protein EOO16_01510 [Chitinophagaceae bacterium]|nr:MAG: hypothetical protein EOO16_01510 [Chitinophagaceae bacterium]